MALQPLQPPRRLRGVALHSPPMRLGAGGRQQCSHESMIDRPIVRKCAPRFPQGETVDGETPSSDGEGTGRGWRGVGGAKQHLQISKTKTRSRAACSPLQMGPVRAPAAYVTGPLTSPENPPGFNCRPVSARARTSPPPHRGLVVRKVRNPRKKFEDWLDEWPEEWPNNVGVSSRISCWKWLGVECTLPGAGGGRNGLCWRSAADGWVGGILRPQIQGTPPKKCRLPFPAPTRPWPRRRRPPRPRRRAARRTPR
eukprot:gene23963-biopygen20863